MALAAGTRLGPYEVISQIGEGGMGAADAFARDAERLARFEREAKTLAALNHPYIAAIYGFERSSGTQSLVMELVEGDRSRQRRGSRSGSQGGAT